MRFDLPAGIDEKCDTCSRPAFASDSKQGWKDCCTDCRMSRGARHGKDCAIRIREMAERFAGQFGVKL